MLKLLYKILLDEWGSTLAVTYSFSPNTLIASSQMNTNFDDVEAVVNALTATNYSADSVGAAALGSDVVRSGYGLIQHTDGSLYVDVSDTNPCLEITDGGVRVKVDDATIERASGGLQVKQSGLDHGSIGGLSDDDHTQYLLKTGSIASVTTRDHDLLNGLTDNDHPHYARGQSNNYRIDSGSVSMASGETKVVSFNTTFSSAPTVALGQQYASAPNNLASLNITAITATSVTFYNNADVTITAHWVAVGPAAA